MLHYRVFEETCVIEKTEYTAYGVAAFDEYGEMICAAADITTIKEKARALAEYCENAQLSPIHLLDVVEDYIISDYY